MTTTQWLWLLGFWLLLGVVLGYLATLPLMRRRPPDPPDDPARYGLPRQEVRFLSRDGLQLGGWWAAAQNARGTVIVCPGQNGSADKDVPLMAPLHQAGFNVLLFDWRAHGHSEGELVTLGALEQADLFGALDYVQREHGVERVGLLGLSMGAGVALMVAAQDARVGALVVDGAYPSLRALLVGYLRARGVPRRVGRALAGVTLLMGSLRAGHMLWDVQPRRAVERLSVPTFFIHAEQDQFTSRDAIEQMRERVNARTALWLVPNCAHREAFSRYPQEYGERVVGWFLSALSDTPSA